MTPAGYFQQLALNGQCFIGSTAAAGAVLPIYTNTSQTFGLWNPTGSNVNVVLNKLTLGAATVTTTVLATLGIAYTANAGSQIGTGAPVVSLTQVSPVNAIVGGGDSSKVRFAPAAITTVAAPAWLYGLGIFSPDGDMATSLSNVIISYDFNGSLIVPPGVAIYLAGTAASGQTYNCTLTWAEVPVS